MRIRNLEVEVPLITHAQRSCKFRIDSINMFVKNKHFLASHFLHGSDNWLIMYNAILFVPNNSKYVINIFCNVI